jgi:hypothetical protein
VQHQLCHCDIGGTTSNAQIETFAALESTYSTDQLTVTASSSSPVPWA